MPCGWVKPSPAGQFSAKYPHFVFHKSKRLLTEDVLEEQWEVLEERGISLEASEYVSDCIDQICETQLAGHAADKREGSVK